MVLDGLYGPDIACLNDPSLPCGDRTAPWDKLDTVVPGGIACAQPLFQRHHPVGRNTVRVAEQPFEGGHPIPGIPGGSPSKYPMSR
eukprot:1599362-Alexandrium_andersonii.AAC.1